MELAASQGALRLCHACGSGIAGNVRDFVSEGTLSRAVNLLPKAQTIHIIHFSIKKTRQKADSDGLNGRLQDQRGDFKRSLTEILPRLSETGMADSDAPVAHDWKTKQD